MPEALSRRKLFTAASGVVAAAAFVSAAPGARAGVMATTQNEKVLQTWFDLWGNVREWAPFDAMLTDDFVFSSPNDQDHISKADFKAQCWDTQNSLTKGFDFDALATNGDWVFVKYTGHTVAGKDFTNVELHRVRGDKIASIECYFGGKMNFPSSVDAKG